MEQTTSSASIPEEQLLTVQDVARRLNVPRSWVYSKVERNQLPHLKLAKYVRFRVADIDAYLRAQQRGAHVG